MLIMYIQTQHQSVNGFVSHQSNIITTSWSSIDSWWEGMKEQTWMMARLESNKSSITDSSMSTLKTNPAWESCNSSEDELLSKAQYIHLLSNTKGPLPHVISCILIRSHILCCSVCSSTRDAVGRWFWLLWVWSKCRIMNTETHVFPPAVSTDKWEKLTG